MILILAGLLILWSLPGCTVVRTERFAAGVSGKEGQVVERETRYEPVVFPVVVAPTYPGMGVVNPAVYVYRRPIYYHYYPAAVYRYQTPVIYPRQVVHVHRHR